MRSLGQPLAICRRIGAGPFTTTTTTVDHQVRVSFSTSWATMLPSYNDNSVQRSLSRLAGKESLLGRRPFIRWIALSCIILGVFIFFVQPFSIPTFNPLDDSGVYDLPPPPPTGPPPPHAAPHGGPPPPRPPPRPDHLPLPKPPPHGELAAVWDDRKEQVKQTFLHAWNGYMTKAFPNDEVLPLSGRTSNKCVLIQTETPDARPSLT